MSAQEEINKFASSLKIVPCVKTSVPQLIGFFGNSGGGKTVTAMVCLVGMLGPRAKIGVVDTENRRAGVAADIVKAMALEFYKEAPEIICVNLESPFHPLRYVAAIQVLKEAGCQGYCVDSMSHAWAGDGGYLDLKEEALDRMTRGMSPQDPGYWKRRESCAMAAAAQVKPHTHAKLVNAILQIKAPTVLCFRSKEKTVISREQGKTKIEVDPFGTPIQEGGMIYEMLIAGEVSSRDGIGGYCSFRGEGPKKTTHPAILKLLPQEGEQFGFGHGQALGEWCGNPGGYQAPPRPAAPEPPKAPQEAPGRPTASQPALPLSSPSPGPESPVAPPKPAQAPALAPLSEVELRKRLVAELWNVTAPLRQPEERTWVTVKAWLWKKRIIPEGMTSNQLSIEELQEAIAKVKIELAQ